MQTRITTQIFFFNLRKIDNKWKNYIIITRVKLSVELDILAIHEQQIFIQLKLSNIGGVLTNLESKKK